MNKNINLLMEQIEKVAVIKSDTVLSIDDKIDIDWCCEDTETAFELQRRFNKIYNNCDSIVYINSNGTPRFRIFFSKQVINNIKNEIYNNENTETVTKDKSEPEFTASNMKNIADNHNRQLIADVMKTIKSEIIKDSSNGAYETFIDLNLNETIILEILYNLSNLGFNCESGTTEQRNWYINIDWKNPSN